MSQDEDRRKLGIVYLLALPDGEWTSADVDFARELLALTQPEFAEKIGFSRPAIAKVEGGAKPGPGMEDAIRKLLALGLSHRDSMLIWCRRRRIDLWRQLDAFDRGMRTGGNDGTGPTDTTAASIARVKDHLAQVEEVEADALALPTS